MVQLLYPVFKIDGEEYVADVTMVLTSNPPKYNAYRLSDKKHCYVNCSEAIGNKIMYPYDFYEFMYGKIYSTAIIDNRESISVKTEIAEDTPIFEPNLKVDAVTHPRPKSIEERVQALEDAVKALENKTE